MRFFLTFNISLFTCVLLSAQAIPLFEVGEFPTDTPREYRVPVKLTARVADIDFSKPVHLPVAENRTYEVRFEPQKSVHAFAGVEVFYGFSGDARFSGNADYHDIVLVTNPAANSLRILAMTDDGVFTISKQGAGYQLVREEHKGNPDQHGIAESAFTEKSATVEKSLVINAPCGETDADGRHLVDVLFTYSIEASTLEGDIMAHAVTMAEAANVGFANSQVDNLRIRVVDIAVKDNLIGVHSPGLGDNLVLYEPEMDVVAADMIADFQGFAEGADNNFGGWASTGGRSSISYIADGGGVFRHEFGHNLGSSHCSAGIRPYAAGYDNGTDKTIMCGNQVAYFSSPDIDLGNGAIGVNGSADNARLGREVAVIKSNYERHVVPFFDGDDGTCDAPIPDGYYTIRNVATGGYLSPTASGARGDKLFQRDAADGLAEVWEVHNTGSGRVMLHNANTGKVIDVFGGTGARGANVGLWDFNASDAQTQLIAETDAGNHTIQMMNNGWYLRPESASDGDGAEVRQDSLSETMLDEWVFTPATGSLLPPGTFATVSATQTPASCLGEASGSITVNATGGEGNFTYEWFDGQTTPTVDNLTSGEYRVTVTDGDRQYLLISHVMTKAPLFINATVNPTLPGTKGTITIDNVSNATGALTYAWSDGGTGASRTGLDAGDYTVTATDANGCTDTRIFRIGRFLDLEQDYVLEDISSGLYVAPPVRSPWWANQEPTILGDCPTEEYAYEFDFDGAFTGTLLVKHSISGATWNVGSDRQVHHYYSAGNRSQYYFWEFEDSPDDDLIRLNTFGPEGCLTATGTTSALSIQPCGSGPQTFRLIPVGDCATAGDDCSDGNNSTDGDKVNLFCDCCGDETACFGVEGAAPNGDGDLDGDGFCVTDDCDDGDASIFRGALCDDGDAATYGDALGRNCSCLGRPEVCPEEGDALDVVSLQATVVAKDNDRNSPSADVLVDGIIDGDWANGNVWHSGGWYSHVDMDLNAVQSIREIRIYPRTECCPRVSNLYVFVSSTPFYGVTLEDSRDNAEYEYQVPSDHPGSDPVIIQPTRLGRYLRIKDASGQYINLTEIEVRSCPLENDIVLPVGLLSFTGRLLDKLNQLDWKVGYEEDFNRYVVERSQTGANAWEELGSIAGTGGGAAEYRFIDRAPLASGHYRLRMENLDGSLEYSPIVHLTRADQVDDFSIAPVPARETVHLRGVTAEMGEFSIFSTTGQLMQRLVPVEGEGSLRLDVSRWPAGVYLVRDGRGKTKRLVVGR